MNVLAIYLEFAKLSERNFEVGFPKEMSVPSKVLQKLHICKCSSVFFTNRIKFYLFYANI